MVVGEIMEIGKIIYLIGLTKDEDFPYETISSSIVDSSFEDSKHTFIIRNYNREYVKYEVEIGDKFVKILKEKDNNFVFYDLKFSKILNRYFADLHVNSSRCMIYELSDDILNNDNVLDWKIIKEFYEPKQDKKRK